MHKNFLMFEMSFLLERNKSQYQYFRPVIWQV